MACSGRVIEICLVLLLRIFRFQLIGSHQVSFKKRELDFVLLRQGKDFSHIYEQALMWFFTQRNGILVSENSLQFVGLKMWWKDICKNVLFTGFVGLR